jgi:uncharacterized membrane protein SirB2
VNLTLYSTLKLVHVGSVVVSGLGFLLRYAMVRRGSVMVRTLAFRTVPHVIDTLLLASAVSLAVLARIDPVSSGWLAAKIIGLIAYIVTGSVALRGPTQTRPVAFALAVMAFVYIVMVAVTRQPLGILAGADA